MAAVKHILVPTDGSEGARKAAAFAAVLARALDARVSVLFVQSEEMIVPHAWGPADSLGAPPGGFMSVDEIRSMLEQRVRDKELPDTVSALGTPDLDTQSFVVWGHVAEEIAKFAADRSVDLIVIGSHGRTGVRRALLGSVSNAVANQAPCPVTIVK